MLAAVGGDASIDLDRDILDTPMGDLGFDSLALMDVADIVEREHGVRIPEDGLEETMATPRKALSYIENLLVGAAA
ncbi:acyl carrier protein [Streptomyces sp. MST-110588]|nr:acyl carrier protein [Streptomyces sp. MST-110588]